MKSLLRYILIFLAIVLLAGYSIVLFRNNNESGGNNPNQSETIDFSSMSYSAFGDSITYGADNSKGYAQMDDPYPELVASILGAKSYTNYGVSGATIVTDVDTLSSIYTQCVNAEYGANIVSVMGGVNDYNRDVEIGDIRDTSTTTFYGSLNAICKLLKEKYPTAFIFFLTPYKEYPYHETTCDTPNDSGYILEDYANAIKLVCANYDIPVLDMFNNGKFELEMNNSNSDGLHPSQEFVRNYTAPQIAQFIKDNYKK